MDDKGLKGSDPNGTKIRPGCTIQPRHEAGNSRAKPLIFRAGVLNLVPFGSDPYTAKGVPTAGSVSLKMGSDRIVCSARGLL